jgi:hypothetical protein
LHVRGSRSATSSNLTGHQGLKKYFALGQQQAAIQQGIKGKKVQGCILFYFAEPVFCGFCCWSGLNAMLDW